ncbi:MAG TPA: AI-2E family transporter [Elusimicrobiota bacterium]|nr:AI-2E family transporter [Elusimicrobiota bacterium]
MAAARRTRLASHLLFAGLGAAVVVFRLGPTLLAGFFSFAILDMTFRALSVRVRPRLARPLSLAVFLMVASLSLYALGHFLHQSVSAVPSILGKVLPEMDQLGDRYGLDLPFENLDAFRQALFQELRENAVDIPHFGGLLSRQLLYVILSVFCAILAFVADAESPEDDTLYGHLRTEFDARVRSFLRSFERVLGAQVAVSAVNAALTFLFLTAMGIPHRHFLSAAAFFLGVLPVVGNILSNTLISLAALTVSFRDAALSLVFLVVIHKIQYVLSGRIIGSTIRIPMWQTLVAILVGEAVLGLSGVLLAPAVLHYARQELRAIPAS